PPKFTYGLLNGNEVQLFPCWPVPPGAIGLFSLNPMFDATASPPASRMTVAINRTASGRRHDVKRYIGFASFSDLEEPGFCTSLCLNTSTPVLGGMYAQIPSCQRKIDSPHSIL